MIILRKNLQDILDENGLGNLHIEKEQKDKYICLVGKCGKKYFTFTSIEVDNRINKEEREYLEELLTAYILKNKKDIKFVVKNSDLSFNYKSDKYNFKKNYNNKVFTAYKTSTLNIQVEYNIEKKIFILDLNKVTEDELNTFTEELLDYKKELMKYVAAYLEYAIIRSKINDINTCTL